MKYMGIKKSLNFDGMIEKGKTNSPFLAVPISWSSMALIWSAADIVKSFVLTLGCQTFIWNIKICEEILAADPSAGASDSASHPVRSDVNNIWFGAGNVERR